MGEAVIHPSAVVGPGVILGDNVTVGPCATILGPCVVEDNVWIGPGAHIGAPPEMSSLHQNTAWSGELDHAGVRISSDSVIREGVIIHQGSHRETTVGPGSWILNRAYLAHDVVVGAGSTVSAGVSIGGHCSIGDGVNLGMNASVHQRTFIGAGCMVGMGTPVTRDLPPHTKSYGSPLRVRSLNFVGLERNGVTAEEIGFLEKEYASGNLLLEGVDLSRFGEELASQLRSWISHADRHPATAEWKVR